MTKLAKTLTILYVVQALIGCAVGVVGGVYLFNEYGAKTLICLEQTQQEIQNEFE
jgi:hypothetical protein